ncbi:probable carboxylesterase 8 [Cucurbita moschata]|uniref:Probable carboxylesterase 8 n=1 Tax=Cucurbita moschata TaxID=3662 RepID=A0A6J1EC01_CUCMO|nr:probable carboxylesterase 8 [Cucurbita moschata]
MAESLSATATASIIDPFEHLNIKLNPDGSITRHNQLPTVPPTETPTPNTNNLSTCCSKDIPLNPSNNTFIRLFKPHNIPQNPTNKLPILIDAHGGGFILFSAATQLFHETCCRLSAHLPALIVSFEYRLAPEHRLPAAYDDALEALRWLCRQANQIHGGDCDPWLKDCADFSRCFLLGTSAGGNITFYAALRALDSDLSPVKIVGHIYNQPFFGGIKRTESELRCVNDRILPLSVNDLMWSLALPEGCDRDHWFCDPTVEGPHQEKIRRLQRCLVRGHVGDPLIDRQKEFVKLLEARGVKVDARFREGGYHGVDLFDPSKLQILEDDVKDFIDASLE